MYEVFHVWLFGIGQPIGVLFLVNGTSPTPKVFSVVCSSLYRVEAFWAFLHPVWLVHLCLPSSTAYVGHHIG